MSDNDHKYISIIVMLLLTIFCVVFFGIGTSMIAVMLLIGFLVLRWGAKKGFSFVQWCTKIMKMKPDTEKQNSDSDK